MIEQSEILFLIICFFFSGFYSASEAVLMSVGIDRARQIIEEGGNKGKTMTFMIGKSNELLSTILVGNNIANILAASLVTMISSRIFQSDVVSISTGITTIVILIFGEIIPKTFARAHAEKFVVPVIRFLKWNFFLFFPIVKLMTFITQKVLGEKGELSGRLVTKNDIEYLINKADRENTIDSKQIDLLTSILEFPKIKVKDIMILRSQVKVVDHNSNFAEIINYINHDTHSRYPVCEGDLDHVMGFLHVKDMACVEPQKRDAFDLKTVLKKPFYVYEHMRIHAVFDYMNKKKVHLALVKDENGLIVGIVTLEDIIEEIVGEILDEHDVEESQAKKNLESASLKSGIVIEGHVNLRDLYTDYEVKIPLNDHYSTLAGFVLDMLGNNFPEEGQIIVWEGLSFEIFKVENLEIREIKIKYVDGEKHLFSKQVIESEGKLKNKPPY
jgi:CBS domain containing-hemolysin-like protein